MSFTNDEPDYDESEFEDGDDAPSCEVCLEPLCTSCWACHYCDEEMDEACDMDCEDSPFDYLDPYSYYKDDEDEE